MNLRGEASNKLGDDKDARFYLYGLFQEDGMLVMRAL